MHELALWVGHAASDVSFVETSNAPGKRSPREALVLSAATEEETVQIHTGEEEVEVGRPRVFRVFQAEAITCPY
jgi:hypothetical protein